jgi:RNA polymerase sigma-70 factor, ECF subfamily
MLGDVDDADDATQEALVSAVRAIDRFDGRSSFGTWVYRIAVNTCTDELRRRRRRPVLRFGAPGAGVGTGDELFSQTGAIADGQDVSEIVSDRLALDGALGSLPREFRAAVVLRDLCDLSYEEIATVLDVPLGTVRSRIARARAALAEALGNFGTRDSVQPKVPSERTRERGSPSRGPQRS